MWIEGQAFVPEIEEMKLRELSKRIFPVIRRDGKLHTIKIPDLRKTAYTWDPELLEECEGLYIITRIATHHRRSLK